MKLLPVRAMPALPWERRPRDGYGEAAEPNWREIDWRGHLREVEVGGRRVAYADTGEGDPVLFIHGLGGNWQNWLENIPRVAAEGRRAIAVDLPGFGRSEMPREELSISGYGRCVEELCERLGLEKIAIVGNSMGGFVGVECAIQFPDRVGALTLVSAAGISSADWGRRPFLAGARVVAGIGTAVASRSRRIVARPRLRMLVHGSIMRHPELIATDLLFEVTRGSTGSGFVQALRALTGYDVHDRLSDIRAPTLIVWGRNDMLVAVSDADEYERLIPRSTKLVFENTGHVPMIERPRRFNDCLVEFLAEQQRSDGYGRGASITAGAP